MQIEANRLLKNYQMYKLWCVVFLIAVRLHSGFYAGL